MYINYRLFEYCMMNNAIYVYTLCVLTLDNCRQQFYQHNMISWKQSLPGQDCNKGTA